MALALAKVVCQHPQAIWFVIFISSVCVIVFADGIVEYAPFGLFAVSHSGTIDGPGERYDASKSQEQLVDVRAKILLDLWSTALDKRGGNADLSNVPPAPHFQDCERRSSDITQLDSRGEDGRRPRWTLWRGSLGIELGGGVPFEDDGEEMLFNTKATLGGPYPPWIQGGDEDNLPLTRRAQRDIWLHQHPRNCSGARFLLADWASQLHHISIGVGAEIVAMTGLLAVALKEGRVLITKNYNGANHTGCTGSSHARWSCYFVPEASNECITRALELSSQELAWKEGILTSIRNYPANVIWRGVPVPTMWGKPWEQIQSTAQLNDNLISNYNAQDRRWWRSQGFRYLMRFPSKYLCNLLNTARHEVFGLKAAETVLKTLPSEWPKVPFVVPKRTPIEKLVWNSFGPWMPRPMVSIHVRQGDKGGEMKIFAFEDYMKLAYELRLAFSQVQDIWLSTEMQNVIEESRNYSDWSFYFTNITRQTGTTSMADYMAQLGRMKNFNNAFTNLYMAAESDFFIGALGSTWSCLIDGLRMTNGKMMNGFLTVNDINRLLK